MLLSSENGMAPSYEGMLLHRPRTHGIADMWFSECGYGTIWGRLELRAMICLCAGGTGAGDAESPLQHGRQLAADPQLWQAGAQPASPTWQMKAP